MQHTEQRVTSTSATLATTVVTDRIYSYLYSEDLYNAIKAFRSYPTGADFWNERLKYTLGYPQEMTFSRPTPRDRQNFFRLHFLIQDLQDGKYERKNIQIAPVDIYLQDSGLDGFPRCSFLRRISPGHEETRLELWTDFLRFKGEPGPAGLRTRNDTYSIHLYISGQYQGWIKIYEFKRESWSDYYHEHLKGFQWTLQPNILLIYSSMDILQWNLQDDTSKQIFQSEHSIKGIDLYGDIISVWFEDDKVIYTTIDSESVPSPIETILDQNKQNFRVGDFEWRNFSDGTHIIEHLGSGLTNNVSIYNPNGTKVGNFEVDRPQDKWFVYLDRFVVVVVRQNVFVFSKTGKLLLKEECDYTPKIIFSDIYGRILYTKSEEDLQV